MKRQQRIQRFQLIFLTRYYPDNYHKITQKTFRIKQSYQNKVKTGRKRCTRHNYQDDLHEHIGHRQTINSFSFSASPNFLTNFKLHYFSFIYVIPCNRDFFGLSLLLCLNTEKKSLVKRLIKTIQSHMSNIHKPIPFVKLMVHWYQWYQQQRVSFQWFCW